MPHSRRHFLGLLSALPLTGPEQEPAPRIPSRRALLIAVTGYEENAKKQGYPLRYKNLSTLADIVVLSQALQSRFGFEEQEIRRLTTPQQTTHAEIVREIREWLLAPAKPGDVLYLHFSGHGNQIDCVDGSVYRTLVPSDWKFPSQATPDDHNELTDSELAALIKELQTKLTTGSLFLTFDCCHSGQLAASGMRGAEHAVRSADPRYPLPRSKRPSAPEAQGILPETARVGKDFAVLMACRGDQKAHETGPKPVVDATGKARPTEIGLLSYYLAEGLMQSQPQTSYSELFEYVNSRILIENNRQNPVLEGTKGNRLFSGSAAPTLRYTPVEVRSDGSLTLAQGALSLITRGSTYTLYPEGTQNFSQTTPLGVAQVQAVESSSASLVLLSDSGEPQSAPLSPQERTRYRNARALLKERAFVEDPLLAEVSLLGPARQRQLEERLKPLGLVRLVGLAERAQAQVHLAPVSSGRQLTLVETASGHSLEEVDQPLASLSESELLPALARSLERQARTRYLRALTGGNGQLGPQLEVRLVPCNVKLRPDKANLPENYAWDGNLPLPTHNRFVAQQYFTIQVRNKSLQPVYINLFDIQPNGIVVGLWPSGKGERSLPAYSGVGEAPWLSVAAEDYLVADPKVGSGNQPMVFFVSEPFGTELVKVIGTYAPQDLTPLADYWFDGARLVAYGTESEAGKRGARAAEHPLGRLMSRWRQPIQTRVGIARVPIADWGTASTTFLSAPKR